MKKEIRRGDLAPPHLDDTEIVSYLDGELLREEAEKARAHLESCWKCRSRSAALQASIDAFIRSRQDFLPDLQPAEQRVEQFRQRLIRHASANEQPGFATAILAEVRSRMREFGGALLTHRRPAIAVLAITLLLAAIFNDTLTTKVSAETVLLRVQNYEKVQRPKAGQVLRSSLRIVHVDRASGQERNVADVTVLEDSLTATRYLSAQTGSGRNSHSLLTGAGTESSWLSTSLDSSDFPPAFFPYFESVGWVPDLSVAEFRKLLSGRQSNESSAKRLGNEFELHYPFAPGHSSGIAEALLLVSAADYSPAEVRLVTADRKNEFRFTRTSYASEPRSEEIARLFPPIDTQNQSAASSLPKLAKAVPLSYRNSQASETEVAAASALHQVDACLGEEVNIFPMSNGTVLVQGLVDTAPRRAAIRKSLRDRNLPLQVELFLPQELKSGAELFNPPDQLATPNTGARGTVGATVADLTGQRIPLYDQLYQHFSSAGSSPQDTERQIADFSNQVVTQARQSFLHAWALRKLDDEFATQRITRLSPAATAEIERMRREHRHWISQISRRENEMLDRVGLRVSESLEPQTGAELPSNVVLRLAKEQDDLVRSLFTPSQYAQDPGAGLARLRSVLHQIGG